MIINCAEVSSNPIYQLLIGAVLPRPIAWVSTRSLDGINNLAPFSFFNAFSVQPPILGFAPGLKRVTDASEMEPNERPKVVPKDTLRNVTDTGEFVVQIVSRHLAEKMNQTSGEYPPDVSEFDAVGLTAVPSEMVKPPRVGECLVSMECKLFNIVKLGASSLVLGEILCIHLSDEILRDGKIDLDVLEPIGRLGGNGYSTVTDRFEIARPTV